MLIKSLKRRFKIYYEIKVNMMINTRCRRANSRPVEELSL